MASSTSTGFPSGHWLAEAPLQGFVQGYRVIRELANAQSAFQAIRIVETELLGATLVLDNCLQTSVNDEFAYHEMLVHPALAACARPPRQVLIIGGGDGGTLRRVLEHRSVQRAVMVEIDGQVVALSRRYLPSIASDAFDDPRAELIIGDGMAYLRDTTEQFDAIVIDSTDPVGPAAALFDIAFYRDAARALRPGGMVVTQSGSPIVMGNEMAMANRHLKAVFPIVRPYLALCPTYPTIVWSFQLAALDRDPATVPLKTLARRVAGISRRYYTPEVHRAVFALPANLAAALDSGAEDGIGLLASPAPLSQ